MATIYYERPYVVEHGDVEYTYDLTKRTPGKVFVWEFLRAFKTLEDAEAHAERMSEDYEFVRVRKKVNEDDFLSP